MSVLLNKCITELTSQVAHPLTTRFQLLINLQTLYLPTGAAEAVVVVAETMVTEVVTAVALADTEVFAVADVVLTMSALSLTSAIPVTLDFWYTSSSCFRSVTTRAHHMPVRALRDPALSS